jgi:hypothetical protein
VITTDILVRHIAIVKLTIINNDLDQRQFPFLSSFMPTFPSFFRNPFPSFFNYFGDLNEMTSNVLQPILQQARDQITNDEALQQRLGRNIDIRQPFSQNMSSNTFNGRSSSMVMAEFEVIGSNGRGVATVEARDKIITMLMVDVDGERIVLPLRNSRDRRGNVVDAEIVE